MRSHSSESPAACPHARARSQAPAGDPRAGRAVLRATAPRRSAPSPIRARCGGAERHHRESRNPRRRRRRDARPPRDQRSRRRESTDSAARGRVAHLHRIRASRSTGTLPARGAAGQPRPLPGSSPCRRPTGSPGSALVLAERPPHPGGGRITLESKPGAGSTFEVSIPLAAAEGSTPRPNQMPSITVTSPAPIRAAPAAPARRRRPPGATRHSRPSTLHRRRRRARRAWG